MGSLQSCDGSDICGLHERNQPLVCVQTNFAVPRANMKYDVKGKKQCSSVSSPHKHESLKSITSCERSPGPITHGLQDCAYKRTPAFHTSALSLPVKATTRHTTFSTHASTESPSCSPTSRSSSVSRESSQCGLTSRPIDSSPLTPPRRPITRRPTPYYVTEHLEKDLESWMEAEMVDLSPQTPCLRSPGRCRLTRRPTPYYASEYSDSDPEVGVEAEKPSMVLLQRHLIDHR